MARRKGTLNKHHKPFWDRVTKGDGCWEYHGSRTQDGYGRFKMPDGVTIAAHRMAWILTNGPIPDGFLICHHCDNPPCCRPDHLFIGDYSDNYHDAEVKGRIVICPPVQTPEMRAKASAARKGVPKPPHIVAMLRAMASHPNPSAETRAKLSAASMRRTKSPETRAKISAAHKGKPKSDATKAKLSAIAKQRGIQHRDKLGRITSKRDLQ